MPLVYLTVKQSFLHDHKLPLEYFIYDSQFFQVSFEEYHCPLIFFCFLLEDFQLFSNIANKLLVFQWI